MTSELIVNGVTLSDDRSGNGTFLANGKSYSPIDFGNAFLLTTRSGLEYAINATTGDLGSITDRNDNTLFYTGQGIVSDTGKQVQFERDFAGRIEAIIDPRGLRIEYAYDDNGNLETVTNREDEITTFEYSDASDPHRLTAIFDNQGVKVLEPEYDLITGQLIKLTDASSQTATFDYPSVALPNGEVVERIKDANNVPTELVRDSRGNVVRSING